MHLHMYSCRGTLIEVNLRLAVISYLLPSCVPGDQLSGIKDLLSLCSMAQTQVVRLYSLTVSLPQYLPLPALKWTAAPSDLSGVREELELVVS